MAVFIDYTQEQMESFLRENVPRPKDTFVRIEAAPSTYISDVFITYLSDDLSMEYLKVKVSKHRSPVASLFVPAKYEMSLSVPAHGGEFHDIARTHKVVAQFLEFEDQFEKFVHAKPQEPWL